MEEKNQDLSRKRETVSADKQADGSSQKITNFFPVLRTEGRAKMCGVKTNDSKQKEMLKKMKGKESMTLRSKRLDKANEQSTNEGTSQTKEKLRNISVASALKTPLSQVLRKSIEASEKKEAKHNQLKSAESSANSELQSVKKDYENERGRTLRQKPPLPEKPRRNSWKRRTESNQTQAVNEKTKTSSEIKSRTTQKISTQSLDTLLEEARSESTNLNSGISKQKKPYRKRHFRGSTYGLYLTPAKKRKAAKLKYSNDKPKDDDCSVTSTENNSFLDSEDANSLVSEDFCTPSEKSLVEEDHGSETQNSSKPLIPEKKTEKECSTTQISEETSVTEQTTKKNESELKVELNADYEENTQNVTDLFQDLEEMQWETDQKTADVADNTKSVKSPQYDDISSESVSNALHFSFKGISSNSTDEVKNKSETCKKAMVVDTNNNKNSIPEVDKASNLPNTSEACLGIQDSLSDMFNMKDDSNVTSSAVSGSKPDLSFSTSNQSEAKDINFTASNQSETKDLNFTTISQSETKDELKFNDPDTTVSKDELKFNDPDTASKDESKSNDPDATVSKDKLTFAVSDITENKDGSKIISSDTAKAKEILTLPSDVPVNKENSNLSFPECKRDLNIRSTSLADEKEMDLVSAVLSANEDASDKISPDVLEENEDTPSQMESDDIEDSNIMDTIQENKDDGTNFESSMKIDSSDKQDDIADFANLEDDTDDGASTIATCVKSRQRIKRRFTDDIVDTDLGILSVAAMASVASVKKALIKPDPPKDIYMNLKENWRNGLTNPETYSNDKNKDAVESFHPAATQNEAKRGSSMAKIECVFNYKQSAIKQCSCEGDSYQAKLDKSEEGAFCQAVDSIDDKLLGCSNPVVTSQLVRPSVKIPFTIMCEVHLWRLKHHQACPYCGLFCSQGSYIQCKTNEGKVLHFFHEQCQTKEDGEDPFCLHCGSTQRLKRVHLEMHMTTPPSFFLSQTSNISVVDASKARISFSEYSEFSKKEDEEPNQMFRIEDSDKILSSAGLPNGTYKEELEKLISVLNEEKVRSCNLTAEDFYDMAATGNIVKVLFMLAKGFDPNTKFVSHENETAMHAASAGGHITVVHLLIQAGGVNDALNEKMYTPLMLAVENGHKDVVHYLVMKGALTDFKGENGMSSLHLAAKSGNLEVLKVLMNSRDADINSQDDGGWTPIVWASEHDHLNVVRYLLKRGANPNIRDNEGNIGLHWSAFSGSVEISYLYLDYGCDINAVNELGDTPLHIAARQDSFPCVTLFLSRGADVQVLNKANKLPAECCIDKNSDTYLSLSLNMLLKRITTKFQHKAEKILHRDISRGKEQLAIQCVNAFDDEMPPLDFLYVTENCETMPIKIDRTITSLQSCHCEDDCSTNSCSCASISYQCWYDKEGLLLPEFNLLDPPMLFECNRACSCWSLNCHNRVLQNGITSRLQLIRTKGKGWGVRTLKDIPKGAFICEYVGELISDSAADKRADDSYLFDLDNRDGETYCLDARYYGNISRFINHLCEPNLVPVKVYVDHQDLNFPRIAFFSSRDIKQYEELGFDYGEKFWAIKYKFFTCECGTPKCKYSKEAIHVTLANYYRRLKEEQMEEAAALQQQPEVVAETE